MQSIDRLRASDGTANADVATVQTLRSPGASTIIVDTVVGINDTFYGSMGTPHTFVDPITAETITVISEATAVDFAGHVDSGNLEIDDIAPGYTDLGSAVGDIIIIKPTTQWGDNVADVLEVSHNDDGSFKDDSVSDADMFTDPLNPVIRAVDNMFDHVVSGCVWTADAPGSTKAATCSAGIVYIAGKRLTVAQVTSRVFTASKDVYDGFIDAGDGTATHVYYDNTTNTTSPTLVTAGYTMLNGIIVVGVSSIANAAAINQGQEDKVLPLVSSQALAVTDSLGNLICPRDPNRKLLAYRQILADVTTTTFNSDVDIAGLLAPFIADGVRKVKAYLYSPWMEHSANSTLQILSIREGSTTLNTSHGGQFLSGGDRFQHVVDYHGTPTAGLHSFKGSMQFNQAGTGKITANTSGAVAFIRVEQE